MYNNSRPTEGDREQAALNKLDLIEYIMSHHFLVYII